MICPKKGTSHSGFVYDDHFSLDTLTFTSLHSDGLSIVAVLHSDHRTEPNSDRRGIRGFRARPRHLGAPAGLAPGRTERTEMTQESGFRFQVSCDSDDEVQLCVWADPRPGEQRTVAQQHI